MWRRSTQLTRIAGFETLSTKTIATNVTHQGGHVELDVHNLFGLMSGKATYLALESIFPERRPFLISRSTFLSSGKWTGHWVSHVFYLQPFNFHGTTLARRQL